MKKILFSPVGGTDPISNFRDGALLHICRVYQPDIIYLYLSKEMCDFQEKDDRYRYCLKKLGEKIHKTFEIHEIERKELVNVQIFDIFIEEYRKLLKKIHEKYPEDQLILNVSSGTPAMKSALQFLAAIGEFKMLPIQVGTPEKQINPHAEDRNHYNAEEYWEVNDDNDKNKFKNRCSESISYHFLDEIRKETMIKHIKAYDYVAALEMAKELTKPLDDQTMALLKAANCRLKLNIGEINNLLRPYDVKIILVRREKEERIFEYLLNLEIKIKKEQYADFLRGITPIVVELFKMAAKEYAGINWKKYCTQNDKRQWRWDLDKIHANKKLTRVLDNAYAGNKGNGKFNGWYVYSDHLTAIIDGLSSDAEIKRLTLQIRDIEKSVRNISAHNLVSITEVWVKKYSGYTPMEIYGLLKKYVKRLHWKVKKEAWDSYDKMNELIIGRIKE